MADRQQLSQRRLPTGHLRLRGWAQCRPEETGNQRGLHAPPQPNLGKAEPGRQSQKRVAEAEPEAWLLPPADAQD